MKAQDILEIGLTICHKEIERLRTLSDEAPLDRTRAAMLRGYMRIALDTIDIINPASIGEDLSRMSAAEIELALSNYLKHRARNIGALENGFTLPE